jgi:transglutaminase-like putative cysteine protease
MVQVTIDKRMKQSRKKSLALTLIVSLLFLTIVISVPFSCGGAETQDLEFTIRSSVIYSNNGTRTWNFTNDDRAISLFMNNSWQTVYLTEHSFPIGNVANDDDGNPYAVLQFNKGELKPGENISYNVTYRVVSKPRPPIAITEQESGTLADIPANLSDYLSSGDAWLINDTNLKNLANNLTKDETKVLAMVGNFVSWIEEHIKYSSQHEVPYYPNQTYMTGEGKCDDQAILLITLCRISKIPAYLQIGCIYDSTMFTNETYWDGHVRDVQDKIGWHAWAIVYVPPWGWLPVDLTYVWGGIGGDYINAIRKAAVTSQSVIQYMNISKTDYINSTYQTRDFLQANDFYVYMEDEMTQEITQETVQKNFWQEQIPWILIATGIIIIITEVVVYVRTSKRKATAQKGSMSVNILGVSFLLRS